MWIVCGKDTFFVHDDVLVLLGISRRHASIDEFTGAECIDFDIFLSALITYVPEYGKRNKWSHPNFAEHLTNCVAKLQQTLELTDGNNQYIVQKEMIGEIAAAIRINFLYPQAQLVVKYEGNGHTGFDQLWIEEKKGELTAIHIGEAKGGHGRLSTKHTYPRKINHMGYVNELHTNLVVDEQDSTMVASSVATAENDSKQLTTAWIFYHADSLLEHKFTGLMINIALVYKELFSSMENFNNRFTQENQKIDKYINDYIQYVQQNNTRLAAHYICASVWNPHPTKSVITPEASKQILECLGKTFANTLVITRDVVRNGITYTYKSPGRTERIRSVRLGVPAKTPDKRIEIKKRRHEESLERKENREQEVDKDNRRPAKRALFKSERSKEAEKNKEAAEIPDYVDFSHSTK